MITNITETNRIKNLPTEDFDRVKFTRNLQDFLKKTFNTKGKLIGPFWDLIINKNIGDTDYYLFRLQEVLKDTKKDVFLYYNDRYWLENKVELVFGKTYIVKLNDWHKLTTKEFADKIASKFCRVFRIYETENEIHLIGSDYYYFGDDLDELVFKNNSLQNYYGKDFFKIDFDMNLISNTDFGVYRTDERDFYISKELIEYINNKNKSGNYEYINNKNTFSLLKQLENELTSTENKISDLVKQITKLSNHKESLNNKITDFLHTNFVSPVNRYKKRIQCFRNCLLLNQVLAKKK